MTQWQTDIKCLLGRGAPSLPMESRFHHQGPQAGSRQGTPCLSSGPAKGPEAIGVQDPGPLLGDMHDYKGLW